MFFGLPGSTQAQVRLIGENVVGAPGSVVIVKITAANYVNLISGQGTVSWDNTKIKLDTVVTGAKRAVAILQSNNTLGLDSNANFGTRSPGKVTFSWDDPTLSGITLPDNTVLFALRFKIYATSGVVPVVFGNSPTPLEFVNTGFNVVTNTNSNGSVTIQDNIITTGAITGSPFCQGASVQVPYTTLGTFGGGNIYTAQLSDATGSFASPVNIGTGASPITAVIPVATAAGTAYRIRVTSSNPPVNGTDNGTNLAVNAKPNISATALNANLCAGGSTTITATGGSTYTWSPATGLSATTGTAVTANPSVTTTYTVTGTDGNICTNTTTVTINVTTPPTIGATALNANLCAGNSTTITATGGTSYTWSPAAGLSATTGATVTASPATTTTYTVTGSDGTCPNTKTVTITVNTPPTIGATALLPAICAGNSTTITATGGSSYTWSPATGLSATTGATVTASPATTTTYTVTGSDGTCPNTKTVTITVNTLPTIGATALNANLCAGNSTTITATGGSSYTWSPATGLSATTGATVTASPATTTTYTVTGSDGTCPNTKTVTINVTTPPTIGANALNANLCAGGSTTITANGGSTYTWSPATGLSATTGTTVTANPTVTTTYTVTGVGTGTNTCTNTKTITINVAALPNIGATAADPIICTGSSTILTASGGTSYTWSPAAGLSATTGTTVTANPTTTTTYTVTGTSGTCTNTATVTVTVSPILPVTFKGDTVIADPATQAVVPVRVYGWNNILGTQFSISWNSALATYAGVEALGVSSLLQTDFGTGQTAAGRMVIAWSDPTLTPRSLPDGSILFSIRFNVLAPAGTNIPVFLNGNIIVAEVVNSNNCLIPVTLNPGQIEVAPLLTVSGKVLSESGMPVRTVSLLATGGKPDPQSFTTTTAGTFSFDIYKGHTLGIKGLKQNDVMVNNGVTTLDIAIIRKQILAIQGLGSAYKQLAADANMDGLVSTLDITKIRPVVLAETDFFDHSRQWMFVDAARSLTNPPFPFYSDADTTTTFTNVQGNLVNKNIIGIKIGDVNNSWDNSIARLAAADEINLQPGTERVLPGGTVRIPIRAYRFNGVKGFQFTLQWNPALLQYMSLDGSPMGYIHHNARVAEGKLSLSWDEPSATERSLPEGSIIAWAEFRAIGAEGETSPMKINSSLIVTEAFNTDMLPLDLPDAEGTVSITSTMSVQPPNTAGYALLNNMPNPFSGETNIRFALPEDSDVTLNIADLLGRSVYTYNAPYSAGMHRHGFTATGLAAGTYVCTMQAGAYRGVIKLRVE
ncbi:MAG: hypothetical protein V4543_03185 [Bacteroidota bacterium]